MSDGKLQWHVAFGAALRIELENELEKIQIEDEHLLGKKPMQVDFLIIKLNQNQKIHKNIGQLFQKHNIVEYKSPEDHLSINDFYKVYGYACFYQSNTQQVTAILPEEIGITFVCNKYPQKMLQHLKRVRKINVKKRENGIYELIGDPFPMQLIITHELTKEKNFWMQSLRNDLKSGGEIQNIIDAYEEKKTQLLYQAVMNVIVRANQSQIEEEMQMCEALNELFMSVYAKDIEASNSESRKAGLKEGRREGITALIEAAREWQMPKQEVIQKIIDKFKISQIEAENYVSAYYH